MATNIPYQFYRVSTPGSADTFQLMVSTNTPYGSAPVTNLTDIQKEIDKYSSNTDEWSINYVNSLKTGLQKVGTPSEFIINPTTGQQQLASQLDAQAANEAAVAAGTMIKVPIGSGFGYVPTGSAAAQNIANPVTQPTGIAQGGTSSGTTVSAAAQPDTTRYQILNPDALKSYTENQLERLPDGRILLKAGVQPVAGTVKSITMAGQTTQTTQGQLLGPTEYERLRKQYGVSEANFDQYFSRDAKGNIYLKPQVGSGTIAAAQGAVGQPSAINTTQDLGGRTLLKDQALTTADSTLVTGVLKDFESFVRGQSDLYNQFQQAQSQLQAQSQQVGQQLLEIRSQAEAQRLSAETGLAKIEAEPVPTPFIVGQQREVERAANLKLQSLARIESNLLGQLGLIQEQKNFAQQVYQNESEYRSGLMRTRLQIADYLQNQEDRIFERARTLQNDSREILTNILGAFEGVRSSDLTPQQQAQIANIAGQSGIPIDIVFGAMDNVAAQLEAQALDRELDTQIITVGGRVKLVDKQTGEILQDFGSSSTGGGGGGSGVRYQATEVVGGNKVRVSYDNQGNVVNQVILGPAGDGADTQEIDLYAQYINDPNSWLYDEEGNLEASKIPQSIRVQALNRAEQLAPIEYSEEPSGFLSGVKSYVSSFFDRF